MKSSVRVAIFSIAAALATPAHSAVEASLDRDQISPGETVELTVIHGGGGEPDLGPLKKDFEVLGKSTGSSIRIVNGSMSREEQVRVTLSPKRAGNLQIPALTWDGEKSSPLNLVVVDGSPGNPSGAQGTAAPSDATGSSHLYLTASVDQKQPYVQGAVLLSVRLHTDQQLVQPSLEFSGNSDVSVQQVGKDQSREETNGGHRFLVIERQYLLQPQRSGPLRLDGPTLNAQVEDRNGAGPFGNDPFFRGMMGATRPIRLHGEDIALDVRPRPPGAVGSDWLPARHISLEAAWHPDKLTVHANEPVTLHLRLSAEGLSGAQLPDLATGLALPDGLKSYPDQGKSATDLQGDGIVGSREQDIALIASQPGKYRVPALRVHWWDIDQDMQREINLPEREIEVLPVAGSSPSVPQLPNETDPVARHDASPAVPSAFQPLGPPSTAAGWSPWFWSSLALGGAWLTTLLLWLRSSRRAPVTTPVTLERETTSSAGQARKELIQACDSNNAQAARKHLLLWVQMASSRAAPVGVNALADSLGGAAAGALKELDRACTFGEEWRGDRLKRVLNEISDTRRPSSDQKSLKPLYD